MFVECTCSSNRQDPGRNGWSNRYRRRIDIDIDSLSFRSFLIGRWSLLVSNSRVSGHLITLLFLLTNIKSERSADGFGLDNCCERHCVHKNWQKVAAFIHATTFRRTGSAAARCTTFSIDDLFSLIFREYRPARFLRFSRFAHVIAVYPSRYSRDIFIRSENLKRNNGLDL